MTYSPDFRKKVLLIKQQDQLSDSETAERFGVSQASVVRWSRNIEPKRTRNKPTVKLDWEALAQDVKEHPESFQYERAQRFGMSRQGIAYALTRLNISRKKKRSNTRKPIEKHNKSSKLKEPISRKRINRLLISMKAVLLMICLVDRVIQRLVKEVLVSTMGGAKGRTHVMGALLAGLLVTVTIINGPCEFRGVLDLGDTRFIAQTSLKVCHRDGSCEFS